MATQAFTIHYTSMGGAERLQVPTETEAVLPPGSIVRWTIVSSGLPSPEVPGTSVSGEKLESFPFEERS